MKQKEKPSSLCPSTCFSSPLISDSAASTHTRQASVFIYHPLPVTCFWHEPDHMLEECSCVSDLMFNAFFYLFIYLFILSRFLNVFFVCFFFAVLGKTTLNVASVQSLAEMTIIMSEPVLALMLQYTSTLLPHNN